MDPISLYDEDLSKPQGHRCREAVVLAMRAFLDLLNDAADGESDTIHIETVRRLVAAVMGAEGALTNYFDIHASGCMALFDLLKTESNRSDFFGRTIVEPITPLLNDPESGISRKNLPQLFHALRMILGDEVYTEYKDNCARIANELRGDNDMVPWEMFYADKRIIDIFERSMVALAHSLKRFAPRKDWFLIVMNTDPQSLSLGSHSFVIKEDEDKLDHSFGEAHLAAMLKTLLAPVHPSEFDTARRDDFIHRFGLSPEKAFGQLFVELAQLSPKAKSAYANGFCFQGSLSHRHRLGEGRGDGRAEEA